MPPKRPKTSNDPLSSAGKSSKKIKIEEPDDSFNFEDENSSPTKSKEDLDSSSELLDEISSKKPQKKSDKREHRGTYSKYDREDLLEAVKMVKDKKMSLNLAAKHYNVPKTTICNYAANGAKEPNKRGVEPTLKTEEEQQILSWLLDGSDMGIPRTKDDLLQAAADVLRLNNRSSVFKNGIPTHHWIKTFKNRHNSCVKLRIKSKDIDEGKFFHKFYEFLEKNDYLDALDRPDAFYFIEDTNFELDPNKISSERRMMLKKSLIKNFDEPSTIRIKESVTVTYAFGANGRVLPQLLIFRESFNDMVKVALADQQLQAKFLFTRTHDGGNTKDTFRCFLERVDVQLSNVQRPIFIFCSETLPHVGVELQRWCNDKKIFVISFIPGGTGILNSIDESIYGLKNIRWLREIEDYLEVNESRKFTEVDFVKVLKGLHDKILNESKIIQAFADTGVYPFDRTKMKDSISDMETEEEVDEAADGQKRKTNFIEKMQQMHELSREILRHLKAKKRDDLMLNVRIIEQQLEFIESSL